MKRFKPDENLNRSIARTLRELGHDVATVKEQGWLGWDDEQIIPALRDENRILITLDVEIGDVCRFDPRVTGGVVLLRPDQEGLTEIRSLFERFLLEIVSVAGPGVLLVVTPRGVRQRP